MVVGIVRRLGDLALEPAVRVGEPDAVAQRDDEPARARRRKQPIDAGIGITAFAPVAGSKRLSDGALMSTHQSACSATDHVGHSPSFALTSSTHRNGDSGMSGIRSGGRLAWSAHRTGERGAGRQEAGAGSPLAAFARD